jgi:hypothetical protein
MRYITVPYSISWLALNTNYKIDLGRIWRNQSISEPMTRVLREVMIKLESFIKNNAPGSLYGEWAKKEECWISLKEHSLGVDLSDLKIDFEDINSSKRKRLSLDDAKQAEIDASIEVLKSVHPKTWKKIEAWGRETGKLSLNQGNTAFSIASTVNNNRSFTDTERENGLLIIDIVSRESPELFYDMDEFFELDLEKKEEKINVTIDQIKELVNWDKKNKRLQMYEFKLMNEILKGEKELTDRNNYFAQKNIEKAKKWGFNP